MKIVFPDTATVGDDVDTTVLKKYGEYVYYHNTKPEQLEERLKDADVLVTNKCRIFAPLLEKLPRLKLICVTATGYDNIDIDFCRAHGIAVCNVAGYSTDSVAQVTVGTVLSLINHLPVFDAFVRSGDYTASGIQNRLTPVFHELRGKTWGIYGYGAIGKQVGDAARAFGCKVIVCKRTPEEGTECVSLPELFERSDILSIHTPLNDGTRRSVSADILSHAKPTLILVNTARGAVLDEEAVTDAVLSGRIGAFGTDVYDGEPLRADSPYNRLFGCDNVLFTPHMAWGAYEARVRVIEEVGMNIEAYMRGEKRQRIV